MTWTTSSPARRSGRSSSTSELKIRKFTPQVAETFSLLPHDVGRPIETFAHKLRPPGAGRGSAPGARDGRSPSSASCGRSGKCVLPADPALSGQREHRRRRHHPDRRHRAQSGRGRPVSRALPAQQPARIRSPTPSTSRTRAAASSAPTGAMADAAGRGDPETLVGKTALELPNQSAGAGAAPPGRGGAAHGRGAALQAREAACAADERRELGSGDAAAAARSRAGRSSASPPFSAT